MAKKTIVTCAVTGASFTPTMSPYLPYTPDAIVENAVGAYEAGAAVLHLHQSIEDRLNVIKVLQPELCTCNLGTLNYGGFPMIPKYEGNWKFDWEEEFLELTRREPFTNNFVDIEYMLKVLSNETGTRLEFEAYDLGHLYTLAYYLNMGLVKPPIFIQFVMGTMGGIGADNLDNLVYMRQTAERVLGDGLEWSVLGGGRYQMNVVTAGAIMGSHVRVGLELETANSAEAREMLDLKGIDNVAF